MAVIDTNSVYEMTVKGEADGQAILNVFHYASTLFATVWGPTSAEEFLTAFANSWANGPKTMLSSSYQVSEYILRELTVIEAHPSPPPPTRIAVGVQLAEGGGFLPFGDRPGDPLPTYAAVTYRKRTAVSTRRTRGSMRIGPIAEPDTEMNRIAVASEAVFAAGLIIPMIILTPGDPAGATMTMQVLSKTRWLEQPIGTGGRTSAVPVITISRNVFLGSQVSRKRKNTGGA